jgi:hypothetical protein
MEDLKVTRTNQKRNVTLASSRLKRGAQRGNTEESISSFYRELDVAYLDFLLYDDEYKAAIEADEALKTDYEVVNGLDLQEYSSSVETIYNEAKSVYQEILRTTLTKKVEKMTSKVLEVVHRITNGLTGVTDQEMANLLVDSEELKEPIEELKLLEQGLVDISEEEDSPLMTQLNNSLQLANRTRREVSLKLKLKFKPPVEVESDTSVSGDERDSSQLDAASSNGFPMTVGEQHSVHTITGAKLKWTNPLTAPTGATTQGIGLPPLFTSTTGTSISSPTTVGLSLNALAPRFSTMLSLGTSSPGTMTTSTGLFAGAQFPMGTSQQFPSSVYSTHQGWPHGVPTSPLNLTSTAAPQSPFAAPVPPVFGAPEVKVKRIELPTFSGSHQDWPEFKVLWPKLAVPAHKQQREALAHELRKCLKDDALKLIKNILITGPEALDKMWNRITQYYDDPAASVDAAMSKLHKLHALKEEDPRGLVNFVDEVEGAYSQLVTWDQKSSLNQRDVDRLVNLLPYSTKCRWLAVRSEMGQAARLQPFPLFMTFLERERETFRREAEQQPARQVKKASAHAGSQQTVRSGGNDRPVGNARNKFRRCCVHKQDNKHDTANCSVFSKLTHQEKLDALKSVHACFRCFGDHPRFKCKMKSPCDRCGSPTHPTQLCRTSLNQESSSNAPVVPSNSMHAGIGRKLGIYAIFSVPLAGSKRNAMVFTDDGSDTSYITDTAAKRLGARKLDKWLLEITTTGGQNAAYESQEYEVEMVDRSGRIVSVQLFSLPKITGKLSRLDMDIISQLFPSYDCSNLQRASTEVDILIGTDYFGLHPKREIGSAGENLSLMEGALGICLQGSHHLLKREGLIDSNMVKVIRSATHLPTLQARTHKSMSVMHPIFREPLGSPPKQEHKVQCHLTESESSRIQNFIEGEELVTQVVPKCGSCKCTKCPIKGHTYSFQEEVELKMIQDNLRYDADKQCWFTSYPWKIDPSSLPNNHQAVYASLRRLEVRLQKNEELAVTYQQQMLDMVKREVAREVSPEELSAYTGPKFYISHLGCPNPKSQSTPYRIVFNSSQQFKGISLNEALFKGPDAYLNSQLGVLLRWREKEVALVGDISKMYNSIHLEIPEQHMHRYLWTNLNYQSVPKTFMMTRVNMGDRPAGAISTEAMYMTAEKFKSDHPAAAIMLRIGSYVDDLMESAESLEEAKEISDGAEKILQKGGFRVKFWLFSGEKLEANSTEVLGVTWIPETDSLSYNLSLNFSPKRRGVHTLPDLTEDEVPAMIPEVLTKRLVLSQVMRVYDPMGLLSPVTIVGKILLRETWLTQLGWDDAIPAKLRNQWVRYLTTIYAANKIKYQRALKPSNAVGKPTLVLFSDASDTAYGFAAYIRWKRSGGSVWSRLVMAKSRIAPLVKRSTPQLELNAAIMSKRAREVITKEIRYEFEKVWHLIDSETVLAMLQKTSTRFKLYEGVRVGEIQAAQEGDISDWAWVAGSSNPADWLTRGRAPSELGATSEWFSGPAFLSKPEEEWELKYTSSMKGPLPGEKLIVSSHSTASEDVEPIIKYNQFSSYPRLQRVMARVLNVYKEKSLFAMKQGLKPALLSRSEDVLVRDAQRSIDDECRKVDRGDKVGGKFYRLNPTKINGKWVVGKRLVFNPMAMDNVPQRLLPTKHPLTVLIMKQAHTQTIHGGRDSTLAKFRHRFWTPQGSKVASSVVKGCQECKVRNPKTLSQEMGFLPEERSKPSPPFTSVMVDYFGPYSVRGDVQKRISGKAWGIIFTDMVSRAVFIEGVFEYTTDAFLLALSKFASCRGYPSVMYSDPGSNLVGASRELSDQWKKMWEEDGDRITSHSAERGLSWNFSTADSPWQNGAVEALVKSCKKAICFSMNERRLSPFEFSCMLYDVANIVNERPIGTMPGSDSEINIITPNSLLLGRSTAKNPGGWEPRSSILKRFHLVQEVSQAFWKQWTRSVAPGLITSTKWQVQKRNLQVGDVVLICSESAIKGEYRLGVIKEVFPDSAGVVRKAAVMYKHHTMKDNKLRSREEVVLRPIQRLALVAPISEETSV